MSFSSSAPLHEASSLELQSMRPEDARTPQSQCVHTRPEHDVKRLPWRGRFVSVAQMSLAILIATNKLRRCQLWQSSRRSLPSRRQLSSFAAWSDHVFPRQIVESNALLVSLGQPTVQLVKWRSLTLVMEQKAPRSVSWRFTPKSCEARV